MAEKSLKDVLWEWKEVMSDSESAELFDQKVQMIEMKQTNKIMEERLKGIKAEFKIELI